MPLLVGKFLKDTLVIALIIKIMPTTKQIKCIKGITLCLLDHQIYKYVHIIPCIFLLEDKNKMKERERIELFILHQVIYSNKPIYKLGEQIILTH